VAPSVTDSPVAYARSADGVNIAYQVMGEGPVDAVAAPAFLHLIDAAHDVPALARHYERLAGFCRVIAFDKRGVGLSDRVATSDMLRLDRRLDDLRAVMDAAGSERAAILGGGDGCQIAITFAATYPERVSALFLGSPTARYLAAPDYSEGIPPEYLVPEEVWMKRWGNESAPLSLETLAPSMAADPRWRMTLARLQRRAGTPSSACRYWNTAFAETDIRDVLSAVQAPTLVTHVQDDRVFPIAQGRYVARGIAGARFVELPGTDTIYWFENGDRVAEHLEELLTGAHAKPRNDRRLATLLMTDIVHSTVTASNLGDSRWRELLDSHDFESRRTIERYGGRVVKFTGDGYLALFDGPERAIEAALELTAVIGNLGIPIRAGVHTGTVEVRGDDIGGVAVNTCARVQALARPSETLVTRTVKDLVAGTQFNFSARGTHELKGVPDTWQLFALGG
jgi:class 3 adenylate cyclase/alpha-beta hydrolase superfamily lysophospholipase